MRAIVCRRFGPIKALEIADLPAPEPGPQQVRVSLRAASLNFLDTLIVRGRYQLKPPLPFVPGAEMAGRVSAVGANAGGVRVGDAVAVRGSYGCLAQEVVADAEKVVPIMQPADWRAAAAVSVTYSTAYHALVHRAALRAGETILVLGAAGGVGTAAIQVGRALGGRVIAACQGPDRAQICRAAGADATVDYSVRDLRGQVRGAAGPEGVQVVVDCVGGEHAEPALRSLGKQGRYLVIGFAAGSIPSIPANLLLLKGASMIGVNADFSRDNLPLYRQTMDTILEWLRTGSIQPVISATFPLEGAIEALDRLARRELHGKVVIVA
jgi:NADPH:quinone reductase